jgi:hypothetical protein
LSKATHRQRANHIWYCISVRVALGRSEAADSFDAGSLVLAPEPFSPASATSCSCLSVKYSPRMLPGWLRLPRNRSLLQTQFDEMHTIVVLQRLDFLPDHPRNWQQKELSDIPPQAFRLYGEPGLHRFKRAAQVLDIRGKVEIAGISAFEAADGQPRLEHVEEQSRVPRLAIIHGNTSHSGSLSPLPDFSSRGIERIWAGGRYEPDQPVAALAFFVRLASRSSDADGHLLRKHERIPRQFEQPPAGRARAGREHTVIRSVPVWCRLGSPYRARNRVAGRIVALSATDFALWSDSPCRRRA